MDKIFVTSFGLALIIFIAWFFFGKKQKAVAVKDAVDILVSGGYSPEVISVEKGKPLTLIFTRTDPSPCLEEVMLTDFGIRKTLPLNEPVQVKFTPTKAGGFTYSCGMNMYHGKILVS